MITLAADNTTPSTLCGGIGQPSCLPLDRWALYAGSLNSRNGSGQWFDQIATGMSNLPAWLEGLLVSLGNGIWHLTGKAVAQAGRLDLLDQSGWVVDQLFAAMGKFLLGDATKGYQGAHMFLPAVILLFATITGLAAVWRNAGRAMLLKRLVAGVLGLGLFLAGSWAAQLSSNVGPHMGSPWWIATQANGFANVAGGSFMNGATEQLVDGTAGSMSKSDTPNLLDCRRYVSQLHKEADTRPSSIAIADDKNSRDVKGGSSENLDATVYRNEVSRIWEQSGLRLWAAAQYGAADGTMLPPKGSANANSTNPETRAKAQQAATSIDDTDGTAASDNQMRAFCRILESRAGIPGDTQAELTNRAAGDAAKGQKLAAGNAGAFNKALLYTTSQDELNAEKGVSDAVKEDRLNVIWETCAFRDGKWAVTRGWDWVGAIQGSGRGIPGQETNTAANCQAIISGKIGEVQYPAILGLTDEEKGQYFAADAAGGAIKSGANLTGNTIGGLIAGDAVSNYLLNARAAQYYNYAVAKFDVPETSGWEKIARDWAAGGQIRKAANDHDAYMEQGKALAQAGQTEAAAEAYGKAKEAEKKQKAAENAVSYDNPDVNASIATVKYLHGSAGFGDIGGGVLFIVSAISNLIIWGGFALLLIGSRILVNLAALGFYLGAIIWAFMPERGQTSMKGALTNVMGSAMAGWVMSFLASIVAVFTSLLMSWFGGGSPGWTALIAAVSTPACIKLLQYMAVNVLKIGDPFSMAGMRAILRGANVGHAALRIGRGALRVVGGIAGGFAGGMAAGGLKNALKGALSGGLNRRGLVHGAGSAYDRGMKNRDREERRAFYRNGRRGPSDAEKAAARNSKPAGMRKEPEAVTRDDMPAVTVPDTSGMEGATKRGFDEEPKVRRMTDRDAAAQQGDWDTFLRLSDLHTPTPPDLTGLDPVKDKGKIAYRRDQYHKAWEDYGRRRTNLRNQFERLGRRDKNGERILDDKDLPRDAKGHRLTAVKWDRGGVYTPAFQPTDREMRNRLQHRATGTPIPVTHREPSAPDLATMQAQRVVDTQIKPTFDAIRHAADTPGRVRTAVGDEIKETVDYTGQAMRESAAAAEQAIQRKIAAMRNRRRRTASSTTATPPPIPLPKGVDRLPRPVRTVYSGKDRKPASYPIGGGTNTGPDTGRTDFPIGSRA